MTIPKYRPAKVIETGLVDVEVEFLDTKYRVTAEASQQFQIGEVVAVTDSPRARSYRFEYTGTFTAHKLKGEII